MAALLLGTLLALGALAYVLWPLILAEGSPPRFAVTPAPHAMFTDDHGEAVTALREIEFDHATGKLSESDYAALKKHYTSDAVAAMRERDNLVEDPVERAIQQARAQQRVCAACGPRPEPAARYCSRCGAALM